MLFEKRTDPNYVCTLDLKSAKDRFELFDLQKIITNANNEPVSVRRAPHRKIVLKSYNTCTEVPRLYGGRVDVYFEFVR